MGNTSGNGGFDTSSIKNIGKIKPVTPVKTEAEKQAEIAAMPEGTVSERLKKRFADAPTALQKDIISGTEFGESVLGPEGLGRIEEDPEIAALKQQHAEMAKGFTSKEMTARRESGLEAISAGTTARSRQLQAMMARAGVKGAAAGAQLGQVAAEGIQARGQLERDLLMAQRAAKGEGLAAQTGLVTGLKQFDIGQAAKEKDVALQAGLGIAGLGATERGADKAAAAAKEAAKASKVKAPRQKFLGIF